MFWTRCLIKHASYSLLDSYNLQVTEGKSNLKNLAQFGADHVLHSLGDVCRVAPMLPHRHHRMMLHRRHLSVNLRPAAPSGSLVLWER